MIGGIFSLTDAEYDFDPGSAKLTLTGPLDGSRIGGEIRIEVTLALQSFHLSGDSAVYFGDEEVKSGEPVVYKTGGTFELARGEDARVITYTDDLEDPGIGTTRIFVLNTRGEHILRRRGEPMFVEDSESTEGFVRATFSGGEPERHIGNEPQIHFGGEPVLFGGADPVQQTRLAHRISGLDMAADVIFTSRLFADEDLGVESRPDLDELVITLGGGNDLFTILTTHAGTTELNTGEGNDRIALRAINGATRVMTGAGDDTVKVGSLAGVWKTVPGQFINVNGTVDAINAVLTIVGGDTVPGDGAELDLLEIDETGDQVDNSGWLGVDSLEGLGMVGRIDFNSIDRLAIALGQGHDEFTVLSTSTGNLRL